jgi:hypothetical protein
MAKAIAVGTGLTTRLVIADGEGTEAFQAGVDDGYIDLLPVSKERRHQFDVMVKLSQGWWPQTNDPECPLSPPGGNNDLSKIGLYGFESVTSIADAFMMYQTSRKLGPGEARMLSTGESVYVQEEGTDFMRRFSGQGDYGFIQRRMEEVIKNTGHLRVPKVIWTALENAGGQDDKKKPVVGPDVIGNALTGKCAAWFGHMLHFSFRSVRQTIAVDGEKMEVERAKRYIFTTPHLEPDDPFKVTHIAGLRLEPELAAKVPPVMGPDVTKLYALINDLRKRAHAAAAYGGSETAVEAQPTGTDTQPQPTNLKLKETNHE